MINFESDSLKVPVLCSNIYIFVYIFNGVPLVPLNCAPDAICPPSCVRGAKILSHPIRTLIIKCTLAVFYVVVSKVCLLSIILPTAVFL